MMKTLFLSILYGVKYAYKTGIGLAAPWLEPVGRKAILIIAFGLTLVVVPWVLKQAGRRAVVAEVTRDVTEIHQKDGAENLELAKRQERLAEELRRAEEKLKQDEKRALEDDYEKDAIDWAAQPLPRSVLERLRGRQN